MYRYRSLRDRAKELFQDHPRIRCPYFAADCRTERRRLLSPAVFGSARAQQAGAEAEVPAPLAIDVIRKAGTVQEYRRIWQPKADGLREAKEVEYWGFVAIIGPRPDKIKVIVRRVGTGNLTLWSVMRGSKVLPDGKQRLAPNRLDDESRRGKGSRN
jgi:hypothetical protein